MNFIDLQVNGYAGVDFNGDGLSAEQLHAACLQLQADNVAGILATIITAEFKTMQHRLRRLFNLREQDALARKIIRGIHLEGPFLSPEPGYRGAHPLKWIRPANVEEMKKLLEAANGLIRLVTLAPEMDNDFLMIRYLKREGVIVSAGHCNPGLKTLQSAVDAGVEMFTHLGNGCPELLPRHDHIISRVLSLKDRLWHCFIADGIHIPFFALRNYLKITGCEKTIIVSDAMAAAAAPPGTYTLGHLEMEIGADRIVREPGKKNFAGSAVTMLQSRKNLLQKVGCSESEAKNMLEIYPQKLVADSTS